METSAIYAYVVQVSDEVLGTGIFSCKRAVSVWRLLLASNVYDRWENSSSEFRAKCRSVWGDTMENLDVETLKSHEHGNFVMSKMFDLCVDCIDDINYNLLPKNDEEESAYWACLDSIRVENLLFSARFN